MTQQDFQSSVLQSLSKIEGKTQSVESKAAVIEAKIKSIETRIEVIEDFMVEQRETNRQTTTILGHLVEKVETIEEYVLELEKYMIDYDHKATSMAFDFRDHSQIYMKQQIQAHEEKHHKFASR